MNFDLSDDQRLLVETATSFVKKESPVERMRKLRDDPVGYEPSMWRHMGELGWLGVLFGEDYGGYGGSVVDAALLIEQFGTTLVPEPYVPALVLAGGAVARAGSEEARKRWLVPLIQGTTTAALASTERHSRYDLHHVATRAERDGSSWRLSGEKIFVDNGHNADWLVVSARVADSTGLFVVEREAVGVTTTPIRTMDGRRAAMIRFEGVTVGDEQLLGRPEDGAAVLETVVDHAAAAACAEGLGIARTVLAMTVDYLGTREQFGVKIGSFQALQHRAVDMFIEVELCHSMMIQAAVEADNPDPDARRAAVSAAKVQLAQGGRYVARQGIQLHGGIGCTDEHDVGLYFKRMQVLGALYGDEAYHVARFARLPGFAAGAAAVSPGARASAIAAT